MQKKDKLLFYISLLIMAFFAFFVLGSREPVLYDDSASYMRITRVEGVMPVYPLFLLLNQYLFGPDGYLNAVVIEQGLAAAACVIVFLKMIKDSFHLHYWETYLLFFLSLMPFTIDMPLSMVTQQILTEGLSFALFYLFAAVLLKAVWTKKYTWFAGGLAMAFALSMLRSQLQILFAVCGVVFFYMMCRKKSGGKPDRIVLRVAAGTVGCLFICLAGIFVISKMTVAYMDMIETNEGFAAFVMKVQTPEELPEKEAQTAAEPFAQELAERKFTTSQYVSLVFSRGMYEADLEDAELFEDETVRGLYLALYEAADAEKQRYAYAQSGLWMWRDIMGGVGQVGKTCLEIPSQYYAENYPEIIRSDQFSKIRNDHLTLIGATLIKAHFGRFLYHTLMMLPQAFICTVFFQMAPIYLLCHLVTLFLYVSALALMVWGFKDKKAEDKCAELMALVLGGNVVMVVVISLVFFGLQRYLVYYFGIFYIAYYLLLRELWSCHIRDRVMKRLGRRK